MAFELGEKNWKLSLSDGARSPSHYTVTAATRRRCSSASARPKPAASSRRKQACTAVMKLDATVSGSTAELIEQGIDNIVVDSSSIEVNRRARRAKTDRLDGDKLLAMLIRYHGGERRVWSVVRVPTPEQEDARRAHRELGRLGQERTGHINRIRALLVLQNLRVKYVGGRLPGSAGGLAMRGNLRPVYVPRSSARASGCRWFGRRSGRSRPSKARRWQPRPNRKSPGLRGYAGSAWVAAGCW